MSEMTPEEFVEPEQEDDEPSYDPEQHDPDAEPDEHP